MSTPSRTFASTRAPRPSSTLEANGATHAGGSSRSVGAAELVNHFVKQGAADEVNLPAALREALVAAVRSSDAKELVKQMRAARSEVFKLMESDSFSRFVLTLPAEANDSRPQGSFPGPAPGVVGEMPHHTKRGPGEG